MWTANMIKRTVCLKTVVQAARLKTLYFKKANYSATGDL